MVFLAPALVLPLLVGPIVGLASPTLRAARRMPGPYAVLTILLWIAVIAWPWTLGAVGDIPSENGPSQLERWGVDPRTGDALSTAVVVVAIALWVASLVSLGLWSRARRRAEAPGGPPRP